VGGLTLDRPFRVAGLDGVRVSPYDDESAPPVEPSGSSPLDPFGPMRPESRFRSPVRPPLLDLVAMADLNFQDAVSVSCGARPPPVLLTEVAVFDRSVEIPSLETAQFDAAVRSVKRKDVTCPNTGTIVCTQSSFGSEGCCYWLFSALPPARIKTRRGGGGRSTRGNDPRARTASGDEPADNGSHLQSSASGHSKNGSCRFACRFGAVCTASRHLITTRKGQYATG
jgi:hypothetical protein